MSEMVAHPAAEESRSGVSEAIAVETVGRRVDVEWNPQAAVTPLGQFRS